MKSNHSFLRKRMVVGGYWSGLLSALLLVMGASPAQAQQTCPINGGGAGSPTVYVQYKVAEAELSKCGYEEYTNQDLPRIHIYHQQTIVTSYDYEYRDSGTKGYNADPEDCVSISYSDGPYNYSQSSKIEGFTHQQSILGALCNYSETYSGDLHTHNNSSDARAYSYANNCITCDWGITNAQLLSDDYSSPQYVPVNGNNTWALVGTSIASSYFMGGYGSADGCGGDCPTGTCSNYTATPYTNTPISVGIPSPTYLAALSPTHEEFDLVAPNNSTGLDPAGGTWTSTETGKETHDLANEYTDSELYGNIMGLMPPYPSGWYAPNADDYDFWLTIAYSVIAGDHDDGGIWTASGNAALQQMQYQFCVPDSQAGAQYLVTWDLTTWDIPTGTIGSVAMSTLVYGTGDPVNPAVSEIQYAAPPWWDESMDPFGGFVITWVDNVSITPMSMSGNSAVAGAGPFAISGRGGSAGCSSCGARSGPFKGGGAFAEFSLGSMTNGLSVLPLQFASALPSLNLATPAGLSYDTENSLLQIIQSGGQIRQAWAPQTFVDVVSNSPFSFDLRYYLPSQVGSLVSGVYQLTGSPYVTWTVANPDASTNIFNRLSITETRSSMTNIYLYTFTSNSPTSTKWVLDYPNNLREDEWDNSVATNMDVSGNQGYFRYVTNIVRVPGGVTQYKSVQVYQRTNSSVGPHLGLGALGFEALIEQIVDPDNNPQTTTYSYYNEGLIGTAKPIQMVVYPNGAWQYFAYYDYLARPATVFSGFGDTPAPSGFPNSSISREDDYSYSPVSPNDDGTLMPYVPRQVQTIINGQAVSMSYAVFTPGERDDIQMVSINNPWNTPGNPVTVTKYYTSGNNVNRVQSVLRPNGTMSFYQYNYAADGTQTNIVYTGQPNSGQTAIIDGTESITVIGPVGQMISSATIDIASGIVLSQDIYSNYDSLNRPQQVTHLDGTTEETQYACCGVDNTTDRDGVVTQFYYDAMKRQVASTRLSITTTNALDALGHDLETIRIGSDNSQIVMSQSAYDLSGRSVLQTNALGGVTQFIHSTDATTGGLVEITINPNGGSVTNFYYLDGSLKKTLGTGVHGVRYENNANYQNTTTAEIKLNADGSDTSEAVTNFSDSLKRPYQTVYSDGSQSQTLYNNASQIITNLDPDQVAMLYQYNGKGEQVYTAIDIDQNGAIDFTGQDRITATASDVTSDHGFNVKRTRSYVWDTDNSNDSNLVSVAEISTDGLRSWNTSYRDSATPVTSSSVTVYAPAGIRYVTNTAPDGSYSVTRFRNGRLMVASQFDSLNNLLGSALYRYDAHGRQFTMTDARNGTTAYSYNNADLVTSVTTPPPQNGQSSETTSTYYNTSLQATNFVSADGGSVVTVYLPTGEMGETYGARTYPVAYNYDYAGRMTNMTTWQSFYSNSGAAVTTWNYDPYRGFLIGKNYNGGVAGPVYSNTPAGRLASRTWARGITTSYGYNTAGDLATIAYSDGVTPNVTCSYDRQGRLIQQATATIQINSAYDTANDLISESYLGGPLNGQAVTNAYDSFLRRTAVALSSQPSTLTQYGYDNASRLSTVTNGSCNVSYSYVANSPLVGQITFQSNTVAAMTTTKSYDFLNRLLSISNTPSSGPGLNFNYSYNSANQRTSVTNLDGSYWLYQYDILGQVISGKKYWRDGTPVAGQQFTYAFDTIGNRTQTQSGGDQNGGNLRVANYTNNLLNQLTGRDVPGYADIKGLSIATNTVTVNGNTAYRKWEYFRQELPINNISGPQWTNISVSATGQNPTNGFMFLAKTPEIFNYDADGNLTNDGRWSYLWDAENRLVNMTSQSTAPTGSMLKLDFLYDSRGRRIQKIVSMWNSSTLNYQPTVTNSFEYDGWNLISILNPQSSILQSFTWGLDLSGSSGGGGVGGLLAASDYGATTTNCFVAYDGNGNIAALVNAVSGTTLASYEYGPFGEIIRNTGPMAKANPLRFSTKYQDDESDLVYYGFRFYNSSHGRWLSRDPISEQGGQNLYGFVNNNPLTGVDKLGQRVVVVPAGSAQEVADMFNQISAVVNAQADNSTGEIHGTCEFCRDPQGQFNGYVCLCMALTSDRTFTIYIVQPAAKATVMNYADGTSETVQAPDRWPGTGGDDFDMVQMWSSKGLTFGLGSFDKKGNYMEAPLWLVLAHELCGHAVPRIGHPGEPRGDRPKHDPSIDIENMISGEHGLTPRGHYLDPKQGESAFHAVGSKTVYYKNKPRINDIPADYKLTIP